MVFPSSVCLRYQKRNNFACSAIGSTWIFQDRNSFLPLNNVPPKCRNQITLQRRSSEYGAGILQSGLLPQRTAGYETWIMHHGSWIAGATLIEIGVFSSRIIIILLGFINMKDFVMRNHTTIQILTYELIVSNLVQFIKPHISLLISKPFPAFQFVHRSISEIKPYE